MRDTYRLVIVLKGNVRVSPLECVVGTVIPGNIINPVGFVVVPKNINKMRGRKRRVSLALLWNYVKCSCSETLPLHSISLQINLRMRV